MKWDNNGSKDHHNYHRRMLLRGFKPGFFRPHCSEWRETQSGHITMMKIIKQLHYNKK